MSEEQVAQCEGDSEQHRAPPGHLPEQTRQALAIPARAAVSSMLPGPGVPATIAEKVTNAITWAGSGRPFTRRSVVLIYRVQPG